MTDKLKACPLCGKSPNLTSSGFVICSGFHCPLGKVRTLPEVWNVRPLESALEAELLEMCDYATCVSMLLSDDDSRLLIPGRKKEMLAKAAATIARLRGLGWSE